MVSRIVIEGSKALYTYNTGTGVVQLHRNPVSYDTEIPDYTNDLYKLLAMNLLVRYLDSYYKNICFYRCKDFGIRLQVQYINGASYVILQFNTPVSIRGTDNTIEFIRYFGNSMAVALRIPFKMITYILSLYSNRDFNGLIQAFDGVLSEYLFDYISVLVPYIASNDTLYLIDWM